ncbi:MAG: pyrroline-5-carboxylate reductase [Alphaproteobacteria bacterium]|nr:pyrroline-5-carboxylate reductase [Alphaproteobacteria bacterium]
MQRLLLIGCGKMGGAILKGILEQHADFHIDVIDHHANASLFPENKNLHFYNSINDITTTPDLTILAVKPQHMNELLESLPKRIKESKTFLSIAAGKTLHYFEQYLGAHTPIIRTMPNTPAAIGKGIIACIANNFVSQNIINEASILLQSTGDVLWVEDESLMDAISAVSGSGPAYLFYFTEMLEKAAIQNGLPPEIAKILARKTMIGAAHLMEQDDIPLETLRRNVTSPNGMTEAGLKALQHENTLNLLLEETLRAATKRSKELGA